MLLLMILVACAHVYAQEKVTVQYIQESISKGKQYTVVFLKANSTYRGDSRVVEENQPKHLEYLFTLKAQGKLPLFGPFSGSGDLRGFCIFNSPDQEEVKQLIDNDPHVKAGYLTYEMHLWFGIPGDRLPE